MTKKMKIISWVCRIVVAVILFQVLFFKFTGAEDSKDIFTTLMGAESEAFGRIGSGIAELIAAILILAPRTVSIGSLFSLGVISGAIISHLTKLGIVVKDDGGGLFALAVVVFVLSAVVLFLHRHELPLIGDSQ